MVTDTPKPKMTQNFFDDVKFFDEADDMYLPPVFRTDQRVRFIFRQRFQPSMQLSLHGSDAWPSNPDGPVF